MLPCNVLTFVHCVLHNVQSGSLTTFNAVHKEASFALAQRWLRGPSRAVPCSRTAPLTLCSAVTLNAVCDVCRAACRCGRCDVLQAARRFRSLCAALQRHAPQVWSSCVQIGFWPLPFSLELLLVLDCTNRLLCQGMYSGAFQSGAPVASA